MFAGGREESLWILSFGMTRTCPGTSGRRLTNAQLREVLKNISDCLIMLLPNTCDMDTYKRQSKVFTVYILRERIHCKGTFSFYLLSSLSSLLFEVLTVQLGIWLRQYSHPPSS